MVQLNVTEKSVMTQTLQKFPHAEGLKTVADVAEYLRLSRSKVYALMEDGSLSYVKLGKSRRIRWSDVQSLVDQNTVSRH